MNYQDRAFLADLVATDEIELPVSILVEAGGAELAVAIAKHLNCAPTFEIESAEKIAETFDLARQNGATERKVIFVTGAMIRSAYALGQAALSAVLTPLEAALKRADNAKFVVVVESEITVSLPPSFLTAIDAVLSDEE